MYRDELIAYMESVGYRYTLKGQGLDIIVGYKWYDLIGLVRRGPASNLFFIVPLKFS